MDEFLRNGQNLLETAGAARAGAGVSGPLSILIGADGAIRTIQHTDWPLESLAREHGARLAYRVSRASGKVRVEGRGPGRTLLLECTLPGVPPTPRLW